MYLISPPRPASAIATAMLQAPAIANTGPGRLGPCSPPTRDQSTVSPVVPFRAGSYVAGPIQARLPAGEVACSAKPWNKARRLYVSLIG
jgi:hypothetical protein